MEEADTESTNNSIFTTPSTLKRKCQCSINKGNYGYEVIEIIVHNKKKKRKHIRDLYSKKDSIPEHQQESVNTVHPSPASSSISMPKSSSKPKDSDRSSSTKDDSASKTSDMNKSLSRKSSAPSSEEILDSIMMHNVCLNQDTRDENSSLFDEISIDESDVPANDRKPSRHSKHSVVKVTSKADGMESNFQLKPLKSDNTSLPRKSSIKSALSTSSKGTR